ncbi:MAG: tripartite tricarboxylate transporter substrate binding protein [Betaproteobacteria bacterium]|nr:tripartite tricarboxylate transporter substrate binding protein [Betaproteobacteria bacterium]
MKRFLPRTFLPLLIFLALAPQTFGQGFPVVFPAKPVRWVAPYAPGGFADSRARQLAVRLADLWKQPVVIENRAGAGGTLGTDVVVKAPADGYTMGMGNLAALAVNKSLMKSMPYDPLSDLAHVVLIEKSPLVLMVHPSVQARSVAEFVALAKATPGKFSFGSSGIGGPHHLSGEILRMLAGIDISHVPYKGGAPAATDLLAGHIPMMFEMMYAALPSIKAGRLRPLAVTTEKRLAVLPDVPTFVELGYAELVVSNWQGAVVPRGTPRETVLALNTAFNRVLEIPAIRESILAQGNEVGGGTPEAFTEFIRSEIPRWAEVIRKANIKPE